MSVRTTKGTTSALFVCDDCDKVFEFHRTARNLARRHARLDGHRVRGEEGISWTFDGRPPDSANRSARQ